MTAESTLPLAQAAAPDLELVASPVAGKHVLVVGINYAPEPTGIAPYTTGVAEHLARSAASVEVFTGLPHYPSWQVPAEYGRRLRTNELVNGVHVRRLKHYVPRTQSALTRALYEATFLVHAQTLRPRYTAGRRHRGDAVPHRSARRRRDRPPATGHRS